MGSGILLWLANPPADIGPVAFVSLIPLLWAARSARPRRGALFGMAFGLTYYGILLSWLLPFGLLGWLPLILSQAAWVALFGALMPLLWRDGRPARSALAAAALWTAIDWARGVWPIGGFTWGGLGYTQHGNTLVLRLASVTGVWGITFVVVLVNGLLLGAAIATARRASGGAVAERRRATGLALVLLALAAVAVAAPSLIQLPAASGRPLDVAVVQGNVPLALASDRLLQTTEVVANHIRLHRSLAGDPPDLAVWPENSLYDDPVADRSLGAAVSAAVRDVGAPTLVGGIADAPGDRFYNQALLYDPEGRIVGRYTKIHLVPFGEYIPFPSVLGWTDRYRRGNALLAPGNRISLFRVDGVSVGTPICFENAFPDLFRRFVADGASLVVVTTNDSSFLFSPASREHVIMSQLRAVENGRWVVQAAISGESAIVDPQGRVVARTGLFRPAVLRYPVPTANGRTLYTRLGDWFPWACGLAVMVALMAAATSRFQRRRSHAAAAAGPGRGADAPPPGERTESGRLSARPLPIGGGQERVLVILPTYNERGTIQEVIAGVLSASPTIDALVVDDGSPDGTGDVVQAIAAADPRVRLLRRAGKLGLASAYLTGFRSGMDAGYDVMVEMDADRSHAPEDLPALLRGAERYDLTIGSRYVPGGAVTNWSGARLRISKAGNAYARALLRLPVHDATSGYRAWRRPALEALLQEGITTEGYAFQIELAYRAWRHGFTVGEVPITFREREHGRSKFSRRIVVEALLRVTQWGIRDRLSGHPHLAPREPRPSS